MNDQPTALPDVRGLVDDADRALATAEAAVQETTQRLEAMAGRLHKVNLQSAMARALAAEREVARLRARLADGAHVPEVPADPAADAGPLRCEYELQVLDDDGTWGFVLAGPYRTATDALVGLAGARRRNPDYQYRAAVAELPPARPLTDAELDSRVLAEDGPRD